MAWDSLVSLFFLGWEVCDKLSTLSPRWHLDRLVLNFLVGEGGKWPKCWDAIVHRRQMWTLHEHKTKDSSKYICCSCVQFSSDRVKHKITYKNMCYKVVYTRLRLHCLKVLSRNRRVSHAPDLIMQTLKVHSIVFRIVIHFVGGVRRKDWIEQAMLLNYSVHGIHHCWRFFRMHCHQEIIKSLEDSVKKHLSCLHMYILPKEHVPQLC